MYCHGPLLLLGVTWFIWQCLGLETTTHECLRQGSIHQVISCFIIYSDFVNAFITPSYYELHLFNILYQQMWNGNCNTSIIPPELSHKLAMQHLDIHGNEYCVLWERVRYDDKATPYNAFGIFVVNLKPARPFLVFQTPHPMSDQYTGFQSAYHFERTGAKALVIAGSRRDACPFQSCCQSHVTSSDPAHENNTFFHVTTPVLQKYYQRTGQRYLVVQLHGMAWTTCHLDVFFSFGYRHPDIDFGLIRKLSMGLLERNNTWFVSKVGSHPCRLIASTNVQGRVLNGVDDMLTCNTPANASSGLFLHVEQSRRPRFPESQDIWVDVWNNALDKAGF
jgi:hypothetical protein